MAPTAEVPAVLSTEDGGFEGLVPWNFPSSAVWIQEATRPVPALTTVRDGVWACRRTGGDFWLTEVGGLYVVWEGDTLKTAQAGNWGYTGSSEPPLVLDPAGITIGSTRADILAAHGDTIDFYGEEVHINLLRYYLDANDIVYWLGTIDCGD